MRFPVPQWMGIVTVGLALASMAGSAWSQTQPIPVGIAVAQTGDIGPAGQEQILGAQIAEEYFNKLGGVNGRPVKLVFQDAGSDEPTAIDAFQSLIHVARVVGIVGPTLSQQAFAAGPLANRAQVPVIGPSNTAKGITQIGEFVSRVSAPVSILAPAAIKAALELRPKIRRVAVLYAQDEAFNRSETETFQFAVTDTFKLDLATVQAFRTTDTDFTAQVTSVLDAKPHLVIVSGLQTDGATVVKQLRERGYKGLIIGGNGLNTTNIFPICKMQCDGLLIAQVYSPEFKSVVNDTFRSMYRGRQDKDPTQLSAQSFTAVQVFVEALRAVDKKTPIAGMDLPRLRIDLNRQLMAGTYETPLGEISFTPSPGGEINQKYSFMAWVKMDADGANGRFVYWK
jgi:branched-chain amino acid transport system substrate-binding protein